MKGKSSFIVMTFAVVGIVLFVSMFASIMTALVALLAYENIATFTALETIIKIAPVVLLIGGIFAASFGYYQGYKGAGSQDASGVLRMVFGIVQIILFVSLFLTILTGFYTLYGTANASLFTAFTTVVAIAPTVLFLGGIFGGTATAVSGFKSRRRRGSRLLS